MSDISSKLSNALSIVQAAKSKISVPQKMTILLAKNDYREPYPEFAPDIKFDTLDNIRNPDIEIIDITNPSGNNDPYAPNPAEFFGELHPEIDPQSDSNDNSSVRSETVSTPDTNDVNSPIRNVTTTTNQDGTETVTTSVTTPTGLTIEEPVTASEQQSTSTNNSGQVDDQKSSVDEREDNNTVIVSTPDTNDVNSPIRNVTTTTNQDGTETVTTSVTTPTGLTIEEPVTASEQQSTSTNNSGQPEGHKSSVDEAQDAQTSSPNMSDDGWTDSDGNGVG